MIYKNRHVRTKVPVGGGCFGTAYVYPSRTRILKRKCWRYCVRIECGTDVVREEHSEARKDEFSAMRGALCRLDWLRWE